MPDHSWGRTLGQRRLLQYAVAVASIATSACGPFVHQCTEIGCGDGASLTLRPPGGAWADGSYTFTATVNKTRHVCAFDFSGGAPLEAAQPLACEAPISGLGASLVQDSECREERSQDAVSQICDRIPGSYTLQFYVGGTPPSLGVELMRDGAALIQQSVDLTYEAHRPNGPSCEPECQQANAAMTFD